MEDQRIVPHEWIAVAAYYLWEDEGSPENNAAVTFANWIDAQAALENPVPIHPFVPPTE